MIEDLKNDELNRAILSHVDHEAASVGQIARELDRPYSTILLRCLHLQAAGLLRSSWKDCTRLFIANGTLKKKGELSRL